MWLQNLSSSSVEDGFKFRGSEDRASAGSSWLLSQEINARLEAAGLMRYP